MSILRADSEFVWHPYTQAKNALPHIPIVKASGTTLFAEDGSTYIDAISSWWVNIHGHAHPEIAKAIANQATELEHVIFAGFTHPPAVKLAERLVGVLPSPLRRIFYSDNGSTAVEVAVKMAVQYFHNRGDKRSVNIIALEDAYHGDTFGAMSVSGFSTFNAPFQDMLFRVSYLPVPTHENIATVLEKMQEMLASDAPCVFIYEPLLQGVAGMRVYEPEHLEALIRLAKKYQALCIADEVMTGFGRTGKLVASLYLETPPDFMCLSKGITGGFMPLGVTACSDAIYEAFLSDDKAKTFFHGHSYTANPLACAAALASLTVLQSASTQQQLAMISARQAAFAERLKEHPRAGNVRHIGTIAACDALVNEGTSYFHSVRDQLYLYGLSRGILMRPLGNVLYLMPPYCISEEELTYCQTVLWEALDSLNN